MIRPQPRKWRRIFLSLGELAAMPKRSKTKAPDTRTYHPEPARDTTEWVIWAAWADRVSFEYIHEQTGLTEADVIKLMRTHQSPSTFRRWRKRVSERATKHRYRFVRQRRQASEWTHEDL